MNFFPVAPCTYQVVLADPPLLSFPFLQFSFLSPEAFQLCLYLLLEDETPFRSSPPPHALCPENWLIPGLDISSLWHSVSLGTCGTRTLAGVGATVEGDEGTCRGRELGRNQGGTGTKGYKRDWQWVRWSWSERSSDPALHLITTVSPTFSLNPFFTIFWTISLYPMGASAARTKCQLLGGPVQVDLVAVPAARWGVQAPRG